MLSRRCMPPEYVFDRVVAAIRRARRRRARRDPLAQAAAARARGGGRRSAGSRSRVRSSYSASVLRHEADRGLGRAAPVLDRSARRPSTVPASASRTPRPSRSSSSCRRRSGRAGRRSRPPRSRSSPRRPQHARRTAARAPRSAAPARRAPLPSCRPMEASRPPRIDAWTTTIDGVRTYVRADARPRSCTPTSTRSTRRSSSATIPRLRGRPVIVGGGRRARGELRGQGARRPHGDGRRAGAPAVPATRSSSRRGCRPTPRRARRCSRCSSDTTPLVEGLSIDEAFLDVRGLRADRRARRPRSPRGCGATVRERVGLPITVGVARTKFLAKVASGVAKPDGLLVVPPDGELAFLHPLPVERLWGVGPVTAGKLHDARASPPSARSPRLAEAALVVDARPGVGPAPARARPQPRPAARAGRPPPRLDRLAARARAGSPTVAGASTPILVGARRPRARAGCAPRGRVGRTVVLRLRFDDFSRAPARTRCRARRPQTADDPRDGARRCSPRAMPLIERQGLTLVGIAVAEPRRRRRASSSTLPFEPAAASALDAALDEVRDRFGSTARSPAPCCSAATRASPCRCFPTDRARDQAHARDLEPGRRAVGADRLRGPLPERTGRLVG